MILLDTNVLSELLKPAPEARVVAWINRRFSECAVSSVAAFELRAGLAVMEAGRRRDALENAMSRIIRRFAGRVFAFDMPSAEAAARLLAAARSAGVGLHQLPSKLADLQIAGIAAAYDLTLATRNLRDFQGVGLTLIDPWAG